MLQHFQHGTMSMKQAADDCSRRASSGAVDPSRLIFDPTQTMIQMNGVSLKIVATLTYSNICNSSGTTTMRYYMSTCWHQLTLAGPRVTSSSVSTVQTSASVAKSYMST